MVAVTMAIAPDDRRRPWAVPAVGEDRARAAPSTRDIFTEPIMRYQRLSYRYTVVTGHRPFWALTQVWRTEQTALFGPGEWVPDADMCETRSGVDVSVDLAGVAEDDFEILLFEDALIVQGHRHLPPCDAEGVYHAAHIRQGPFRLELPLPAAIDAERLQTRYDRGVLRIILPRQGVAG
jgi:HSP20 family protein